MVPGICTALPEGTLDCAICCDLVVGPTTLSCCGTTFCRRCLQRWIQKSVRTSGVPRCPGASCNRKLEFRLPAVNTMLEAVVEALAPDELKQRTEDDSADAEEDDMDVNLGGFASWQEVAAKGDLYCNDKLLVAAGAPGLTVKRQGSDRISVKFDQRVDDSELCVDVVPAELVHQIPERLIFRIGQHVVAARDLKCQSTLLVSFGVKGFVDGPAQEEDRLRVRFEEGADGREQPMINVLPSEIRLYQRGPGGYVFGQQVQAKQDLKSASRLIVRKGVRGVIRDYYNDLRLCVKFEAREDDCDHMVNVLPAEVIPDA